METKEFTLDVKKVSDEGTFEGYASTFGGSPDSYGDIVMPGAFVASLARHKREGSTPAMLFGHRADNLPIGVWQDMAEDGKGLWVQGQITLDDPEAARVHVAMKKKAVRGLSIGYEVLDSERDDKKPGVRMLKELDLWEVSIVNFPANRRSLINQVKEVKDLRDRLAAGDRLTEREWERLLKSQPFSLSNAEAERAVRLHFKGQGEPDGTAEKQSAFYRALLPQ